MEKFVNPFDDQQQFFTKKPVGLSRLIAAGSPQKANAEAFNPRDAQGRDAYTRALEGNQAPFTPRANPYKDRPTDTQLLLDKSAATRAESDRLMRNGLSDAEREPYVSPYGVQPQAAQSAQPVGLAQGSVGKFSVFDPKAAEAAVARGELSPADAQAMAARDASRTGLKAATLDPNPRRYAQDNYVANFGKSSGELGNTERFNNRVVAGHGDAQSVSSLGGGIAKVTLKDGHKMYTNMGVQGVVEPQAKGRWEDTDEYKSGVARAASEKKRAAIFDASRFQEGQPSHTKAMLTLKSIADAEAQAAAGSVEDKKLASYKYTADRKLEGDLAQAGATAGLRAATVSANEAQRGLSEQRNRREEIAKTLSQMSGGDKAREAALTRFAANIGDTGKYTPQQIAVIAANALDTEGGLDELGQHWFSRDKPSDQISMGDWRERPHSFGDYFRGYGDQPMIEDKTTGRVISAREKNSLPEFSRRSLEDQITEGNQRRSERK